MCAIARSSPGHLAHSHTPHSCPVLSSCPVCALCAVIERTLTDIKPHDGRTKAHHPIKGTEPASHQLCPVSSRLRDARPPFPCYPCPCPAWCELVARTTDNCAGLTRVAHIHSQGQRPACDTLLCAMPVSGPVYPCCWHLLALFVSCRHFAACCVVWWLSWRQPKPKHGQHSSV